MGTYSYVVRRLLTMLPTMFIVSSLVFYMGVVIPGDAAGAILGAGTSKEEIEELQHKLGLDRPVHERYLEWLVRLIQGDMGRSLSTDLPVLDEIVKRLPVTFTLTVFAMAWSLAIAIPAGIISAVRRNSKFDAAASIIALQGLSIPAFVTSILLIFIFSIWFPILPGGGYTSLLVDPIDGLRRMILPSLALGTVLAAYTFRMTRSSVLEIMHMEYITTARSKGLPERVVLYRHAMKNAFIPIVTAIGLQFANLMAGAVVIEAVFLMPGVGKLAVQSVFDRDIPMVQGITMISAFLFLFINLVVDAIYTYLDPRIRYK